MRALIRHAPKNYGQTLGPLPQNGSIRTRLAGSFDFVQLFVRDRKNLVQEFQKLKRHLKKDGMLWISWPKRSSGVTTDLSENIIRSLLLPHGLVDIKVCAVDATWSGLKFVYRRK